MIFGTYIIAGIVTVNLLCLLNRKQRNNWDDLWYDTIVRTYEHIKNENGLKKYAHFFIVLLLLPIFLISFLLVAPFSTIENILKKKHKTQKKDESIDKGNDQQYYQYMGGAGTIICNDCGYKEDIVSFLHSFDDEGNPSDGCSGHQCQTCGKFHMIEIEKTVKPYICSCGEDLSRDKALFCPQCKSTNMEYSCRYIT